MRKYLPEITYASEKGIFGLAIFIYIHNESIITAKV